MSTIVCLHAHPDDEASSTGGTIARAAADGHRVVLVVGTDGDHGEVPDDLATGEALIDRRRLETARSAEALGVHRIVWLGYRDSGMTGWEQNSHAEAFMLAPIDEAAEKLAAVLREENADVLTTYDWHGNYGHPDHVKVHHVGHRAADLARTPKRFEATFNRDVLVRMMAQAPSELLEAADFDPAGPADDGNPFGTSEAEINLAVDVSAFVEQRRAALMAHASQVTDTGQMLSMPDDVFREMFGTEWYLEPGAPAGLRWGWLLDGLDR